MEVTEERIRVKILKSVLSKSDLGYAKDALDYINILEKQLALCGVGSSLPKVCKGCGTLSTTVIDKKYLACCPDSNYIPMEDYCKNSIYPDKQF